MSIIILLYCVYFWSGGAADLLPQPGPPFRDFEQRLLGPAGAGTLARRYPGVPCRSDTRH